MKLSKSTVRSLLYSAIKKAAEKLEVDMIDYKTSEELLDEIKSKDDETYRLLKDFIKSYKLANKKDTPKKMSNLNEARSALISKMNSL